MNDTRTREENFVAKGRSLLEVAPKPTNSLREATTVTTSSTRGVSTDRKALGKILSWRRDGSRGLPKDSTLPSIHSGPESKTDAQNHNAPNQPNMRRRTVWISEANKIRTPLDGR